MNKSNNHMKITYLGYFNEKDSKAALHHAINTVDSLSEYTQITFITNFWDKKDLNELLKNHEINPKFKIIRIPLLSTNSKILDQLNRIIYTIIASTLLIFQNTDYIYTPDMAFAYMQSLLPKPLNKKDKFIFESHKIYFKTSQMVSFQKEHRAYNNIPKFVATTQAVKNDLEKHFEIPQKNIVLARNGVNIEKFQTLAQEHINLYQEFTISENSYIISYSGSFKWWKGINTLLESMILLKEKNIHLILMGGTENEIKEIKTYTEKNGIQNLIHFTGYINHDKMTKILAQSHLAVIPNNKSEEGLKYTSPMKLFEYMAVGVPFISSRLPSIKEIIPEEQLSIYFEPENSQDLAQKIQYTISDEQLLEKIHKESLSLVSQYTWKNRADIIYTFIKEIYEIHHSSL